MSDNQTGGMEATMRCGKRTGAMLAGVDAESKVDDPALDWRQDQYLTHVAQAIASERVLVERKQENVRLALDGAVLDTESATSTALDALFDAIETMLNRLGMRKPDLTKSVDPLVRIEAKLDLLLDNR